MKKTLYNWWMKLIGMILFLLFPAMTGAWLTGVYFLRLLQVKSASDIARDYSYLIPGSQSIQLIRFLAYHDVMFLIIGILCLILSVILLFRTWGHRPGSEEIHLSWIDRVPFLLLFLVCILITFFSLGVADDGIFYNLSLSSIAWMVAALYGSLGSLLILTLSVTVRCKAHKFRETTLVYSLRCWYGKNKEHLPLHRWRIEVQNAWFEKNTLRKRAVIVMTVLTVLELIFIAAVGYVPLAILWIIYKVITLPLFYRLLSERSLIKAKIRMIAEGKSYHPEELMKESGVRRKLLHDFQEDSDNLDRIQSGVQVAVNEQMKSERMKTELITNVSHDIKTPLTSIINYVDLMQKNRDSSEFSEEKEREYLAVLARQSSRLKKLIEDLIEASKATTGNLEVKVTDIRVEVILSQAVGEFEDRLNAQQLTLIEKDRVSDKKVWADGRYLWRVFDNLLGNICKYSLPGTRVYVDVFEAGVGMVGISFRNISRSQLSISADELMERFVRGDSSRDTEGNGLGLSIADSLLRLMGGKLELEIDGDLFKATVELQEASQ